MRPRAGCCRHYRFHRSGENGWRNDDRTRAHCLAGRDNDGKALKCLGPEYRLGTCDAREEWKPGELEALKAGIAERRRLIVPTIPGDPFERDSTWGKGGEVECKVCGGTVTWRRTYLRGELIAECSTPECFVYPFIGEHLW